MIDFLIDVVTVSDLVTFGIILLVGSALLSAVSGLIDIAAYLMLIAGLLILVIAGVMVLFPDLIGTVYGLGWGSVLPQ